LFIIALCIGITALSWGAYGPVLHKGQAKMGGGRLRPFLCGASLILPSPLSFPGFYWELEYLKKLEVGNMLAVFSGHYWQERREQLERSGSSMRSTSAANQFSSCRWFSALLRW
jgi:hypothetical protein